MLITFRCKAAPEIMMYKEHAKRILELLDKDPNRGVITAAEAPKAVEVLEKEIAESRQHPPSDEVQRDIKAHAGDVDDKEHEGVESVSFATRAYPLLAMLREARDQKCDVMWGVL